MGEQVESAPVEIPVAFCDECDKEVPVYIKEYELVGDEFEELDGAIFEAVICPICVSILNLDKDELEIHYYLPEDISSVIDFKVVYDEQQKRKDS